LRPLRALIVDDELLVAWHLESLLEDLGYEVCDIAASADAAAAAFRSSEPDLVFMDVNLGSGPNGIDAARVLLADRAVPIIFVTAYGDPTTRAAIAGVAPKSLVMSKPVTPLDLSRAIEAVLGTHH
jgi:CheY-like chemotaxis protein